MNIEIGVWETLEDEISAACTDPLLQRVCGVRIEKAKRDPDLAEIRGHPKFEQLLARAKNDGWDRSVPK